MHLYIYQVFREPRPKADWSTETNFINNPELMPYADYVSGSVDRNTALHVLGERLERHGFGTLSGSAFTLAPDAAQRYLKNRFEVFRKALDALNKVTEAQFIHSYQHVEGLFSDLHSDFSNPYSDYVMVADELPVPFDQFIRMAEPGVPFYIGSIMDCHY